MKAWRKRRTDSYLIRKNCELFPIFLNSRSDSFPFNFSFSVFVSIHLSWCCLLSFLYNVSLWRSEHFISWKLYAQMGFYDKWLAKLRKSWSILISTSFHVGDATENIIKSRDILASALTINKLKLAFESRLNMHALVLRLFPSFTNCRTAETHDEYQIKRFRAFDFQYIIVTYRPHHHGV